MTPIPAALIEQHRIKGSGQQHGSRHNRSRLAGLPLRGFALLLAHGLATLTLLLGLTIWSDWRSPDQTVSHWLVFSLVLLLCFNPFAALALASMIAAPTDVISIARALITRPMMAGHRNTILLVALGFTSSAFLASVALTLLFRLT